MLVDTFKTRRGDRPKAVRTLLPSWAFGLGVLGLIALGPAIPIACAGDLPPDLADRVQLNRSRSDFSAALSDLHAQQEALGDDPDFNYLLGVVALEAGQPLVALDALERVVLHHPEYAGAWLDLAIAHTRLGDSASAEAILDHVEATFSPPVALREQIAKARASLRQQTRRETAKKPWHGEVAVLGGYTSNANAGLAVGGFNLTPVGGDPVPILLADSQRPRGDAVLQSRASLYRDFAHDSGSTTSLLAYFRGRQYAQEGDYTYYEAALGASHNLPIAPGRSVVLGASLRQLTLGGRPLALFAGSSAGLRQVLGACMAQANIEFEYRHYQQTAYYSAEVFWGGAGLDCQWRGNAVQLAVRAGLDSARGDRAGGDTTRIETSLLWRRDWTPRWTSELLLYAIHNADQAGYSPLLDNNAARQVNRLGERLSLSRTLDSGGRWRASIELENARDYSNLPIFRLNEHQISAGLRYLF